MSLFSHIEISSVLELEVLQKITRLNIDKSQEWESLTELDSRKI